MFCNLQYTAVGAVSIRWVKDGDAMTNWNDDPTVTGGCVRGEPTFVQVTVSDANGTDAAHATAHCPGRPQ
jgi:hypothetical protein